MSAPRRRKTILTGISMTHEADYRLRLISAVLRMNRSKTVAFLIENYWETSGIKERFPDANLKRRLKAVVEDRVKDILHPKTKK